MQTRSEHITHTRAAKEAKRLIDKRYERMKSMERAGNPVAWLYYGPPHEILHCFDVLAVFPENFGAVSAIDGKTSPFLEYGEELGLSTLTCSYLRIEIGMARAIARGESTADAPYGGMAKPSMLITTGRHCDPRLKVFDITRRYLDVPVFMFDYQGPPCEDPRVSDRNACQHFIDHNVEGYKSLIAFLEKQTGKKMDWAHFEEIVHTSIDMWHLFWDVTSMRKSTPCPMPSEDAFAVSRPYHDMTGETEAAEFYRNVKDELKDRIANKISVVPEEKYRVLWLGLPTWLDMGIFNYLESRGAVSVMETNLRPYPPFEVDTSDPLRALAEKWFWGWDWGGADGTEIRCGTVTAGNYILDLVRDYKVDGVIAHSVISCRGVSMGNRHTAKLVRERTGVPVLYLESDMSDPRAYSMSEEREKVDGFVQTMEQRKQT